MLPVIGTLIEAGLKILDKVIPDPAAKAAAQLELLKLQQAGEFKELEADMAIALGQIETNKVEAASPDIFKSGWRPATGWVCVAGLGYQFLAQPILPWFIGLWGAHVAPLPSIDNGTLLTLLGGLLGLGSMRTIEKAKGVA